MRLLFSLLLGNLYRTYFSDLSPAAIQGDVTENPDKKEVKALCW